MLSQEDNQFFAVVVTVLSWFEILKNCLLFVSFCSSFWCLGFMMNAFFFQDHSPERLLCSWWFLHSAFLPCMRPPYACSTAPLGAVGRTVQWCVLQAQCRAGRRTRSWLRNWVRNLRSRNVNRRSRIRNRNYWYCWTDDLGRNKGCARGRGDTLNSSWT